MQPEDYYSQAEIADAIVEFSQDREFAGRTYQGQMGSRPNVVHYRNDFFKMAEKFHSFHATLERWTNPLLLGSKARVNEIRKGWDLVIDLDGEQFEIIRTCTKLIIEALRAHGIKSISLKFSGNKGFHIGVPFEAFPPRIDQTATKTLFPEIPKKVSLYLKEFIQDAFTHELMNQFTPKEYAQLLDQPLKEVTKNDKINPWASVSVDTLVVSPRHMIRVPYSLHKKSELASLPIKIEQLKTFRKKQARPEKIKVKTTFLPRKADPNETTELLSLALTYQKPERRRKKSGKKLKRPKTKIAQECFPPCIKKILTGLQDGRKRSEFILRCFLYKTGYDWDEIEEILLEWNKKNTKPLKENYLLGQLRWHKKQKRVIMPPNCDNKAYYQDIRVCDPIPLCSKNPVVTAVKLASKKKRRSKKEEDE